MQQHSEKGNDMKNKIPVIYILLAGILWGCSCLFVSKLTALGFTPMHCTAIRITTAALILNIALIIKGKGFKYYKMDFISFILVVFTGWFSVLSMCIFYYLAMTETSAAVSAILLYTAPLFVMIMSVIFFKEKITAMKIAAFIIAIAGCALVSGIISGVAASTSGIIFGILSAVSYSLYGILTTFFMKRNSERLTFTAVSFAFAAIGALMLTNVKEIIDLTAQADSPLKLIALYPVFGLITAVLPFVFYTKGLSGVRPDVASILAFIEPMTAAVLGIAVLRQPFDFYQGIGIGLIVVSILLLNTKQKNT
ncbi:MAG: hypothetical protein E7456_01200 [Ruminococcaceae bacterium]|nr:hypothetical protein [Oscillospiraceae bacterium]